TSGRIRREFGWPEVGQGLGLVLWGYAVLTLGALGGSALLWFWAQRSQELLHAGKTARHENGVWLAVGLGTLGLTLLVGGVLLLVGQCRCVRHARDRNGAKPWVFVSVTALIVGLVLTLATGALAVLENYPTQQAGWQGAQELTASLTVRILALTTAGVVVLAV